MRKRGIPTAYKGIMYRSRQEARYAAFWDWLGWRFTYEPFDANGYIPDFLIHGDNPLLAEVKTALNEAFAIELRLVTRSLPTHLPVLT